MKIIKVENSYVNWLCPRAPYVKTRFQLVMTAAERARKLAKGSVEALVPWNNDKATVVALREIAAGHLFPVEES